MRFLDNVIDMNNYPLPEIKEMTLANRKIGLGVMGFADMLVMLGIRYGSEESLELAEKLARFIQEESKKVSSALALERGSFPNYGHSIYKDKEPMRNATTTTIAPTGSISIIANASSGIEPIFALVYERHILDGAVLLEVNEYFKKVATEGGFYSEELFKKIADSTSIQNFEEVPSDIREIFVTSHDIKPIEHVKMQAAFQRWVDNAVSKTVNLPSSATVDDVADIYFKAYDIGCKGVTIYRDRSRAEQVLSIRRRKKLKPRPRPLLVQGTTRKMKTGCGNLYVTVNMDDKGPFEVFTQLGKAGGCASSQTEAISRLISLALRSGIDIDEVVEQLKGIRCPSPMFDIGDKILSCPDAIGKALSRIGKKDMTIEQFEKDVNVVGVCPDCGSALIFEEGCAVCKYCGYSKCG